MMRRLLANIALLTTLAPGAFAQGTQHDRPWLWIAGVQGAEPSRYSHLGVIIPAEDAALGQGLFHRTIVSWLSYRYDTTVAGRPVRVKATAPGIETGWGHAWSGPDGQLEASLSLGIRDTELSPSHDDSEVEGVRAALIPQLAARRPLSPRWQAEALGSYSIGPQDRFLRLRLVSTPGAAWQAGVEAAHQAGRRYRQNGLGVFAARSVHPGVRAEFSLGQTRDREGRRDPYVGLALSWTP